MKDYSDFEKLLSSKDNKESKKEIKRLSKKDRSKQKPSKTLSIEGKRGRVLSVSSTEVVVDLEGKEVTCSLRGLLKKEKANQKRIIAIGDFVIVDERGQVASIEERYSQLTRKDNLRRRLAQVIAANIDQVIIVTSVAEPNLKPSLIDRYIISAIRGNMSPLIIINKVDLTKERKALNEIIWIYKNLGIQVIEMSGINQKGIDELKEAMKGKASVFSGQSGVGKTTLINLIAGTDFKTREVVEKTEKGVHTTTKSTLVKIDEETFCIDTPGIKSFSLWDVTTDELSQYFSDLQQFSSDCKFINCTHTHEPDCGVKKAVEEGKISQLRYDSYVTIRDGNDEDQKNHWE